MLTTRYASRSTTFSRLSVEAVNHSRNTSHTHTRQLGPLSHPGLEQALNDTDVFLQVTYPATRHSTPRTGTITNW
jgi:hypothetical protein